MSDEAPDLADALTAIHHQLALLSQQLAALFDQQKELTALVSQVLQHGDVNRPADPGEHLAPTPAGEVLARCSQDLLRMLREVGRPLTTLEILDEMVHRHLSWRESTVSHTLAELIDQGLVSINDDSGPRRHSLAAGERRASCRPG